MDALPIPDDLVELQRAVYAARALSAAFSSTIDRELRDVFPGETPHSVSASSQSPESPREVERDVAVPSPKAPWRSRSATWAGVS